MEYYLRYVMMNNEQDLENKMENEEEKKACAECGEMIPADADYCPFCGKPVMKHLNVDSRPFTLVYAPPVFDTKITKKS